MILLLHFWIWIVSEWKENLLKNWDENEIETEIVLWHRRNSWREYEKMLKLSFSSSRRNSFESKENGATRQLQRIWNNSTESHRSSWNQFNSKKTSNLLRWKNLKESQRISKNPWNLPFNFLTNSQDRRSLRKILRFFNSPQRIPKNPKESQILKASHIRILARILQGSQLLKRSFDSSIHLKESWRIPKHPT